MNAQNREMEADHYQDVIDKFPSEIHKLLIPSDYVWKRGGNLAKVQKKDLDDAVLQNGHLGSATAPAHTA